METLNNTPPTTEPQEPIEEPEPEETQEEPPQVQEEPEAEKPKRAKRAKNPRGREYIVESLEDEPSDTWTRETKPEDNIDSYATADAWIMDNAMDSVPYRISIITKPVVVGVVTTETRTMILGDDD